VEETVNRFRATAAAISVASAILSLVLAPGLTLAGVPAAWPQWGRDPQHTGASNVAGQSIDRILASLVYDPFVPAEQKAEFGDLLAHYQAPLVDGDTVYMEVKTGAFTGASTWNTQIWGEDAFQWSNGQLTKKWAWASQWKPEPNVPAVGSSPTERWGLNGWEPVFHAVLVNNWIYAPDANGAITKINKNSGVVQKTISPNLSGCDAVDRECFVAGPLTADASGNVYYNVLELNMSDPYGVSKANDIPGSWLVKVSGDVPVSAPYSALVRGAPAANDICQATFSLADLPWPPTPDAVVPTGPCGSQRPGINVAPAIAPDGTIYMVTRAHFRTRYGYVVAVNPDLTPKWAASLRGHLADGCNNGSNSVMSVLPLNGTPGGCISGAHPGVDPATNDSPAGRVIDQSSSSPTVAPDGSVFYGAYSRYNFARGHMFKFSSTGAFLASYDFGWDTTPAILSHTDGSYSVVEKDNHYDAGSYCNDKKFCPVAPPGPYYISILNGSAINPATGRLQVDGRFLSTNTLSCQYQNNGNLMCKNDHPGGFEWCINAPAVDANGVIYANSEDGNLYAINPDGSLRKQLFLNLALGAAYTPLAVGTDGKIYTENDGILFVVGQ